MNWDQLKGSSRQPSVLRRYSLNLHLRVVTAGSVLVFAGIIGLGTLGFLPLVLDRVQAGGSDVPRGMPWMPAVPAARPAQPQQVSALPPAAEEPPGKVEEIAQQSPRFDEPAQMMEGGGAVKSALGQQPEPVKIEPPAAAPVVSVENEPAQPQARVPAASLPRETSAPVKRPNTRAERLAPAAKQTANNTAEKRAKEARRAVRRFDDSLRDIPLSAYSGDGSRRMIVIHPTSIQDYYYYSTRR
jgi:hypothetical protein